MAHISEQDKVVTHSEDALISTATNTLNSIANVMSNDTPIPTIQTTETETDISNYHLPNHPHLLLQLLKILCTIKQDNKTLDGVMPIFFKLILLLTVSVFE